ncbi:MAG: GNAT family N-acetyltransferase [Gammaproteobacteria bacterium]|nr:GNAT family N-acetyltransferase [Gammaproteobacteria bacterium]
MLKADTASAPSGGAELQSDARGAGIRAALLTDLDALIALERHFPGDRLSRQSFRRLLQGGSAEVWVYEEAGCVAGDTVLLYRRNSAQARLYSVIVHPRYQGRGIARALLHHAEQAATRRGCQRLSLEVRTDNAPALRLYQKDGFQPVRQIADYYEDHAPALRLEKQVASNKQ